MKIQNYDYLNQEIDVSEQFTTMGNIHFCAEQLMQFDPQLRTGSLQYKRFERKGRIGFNLYSAPFEPTQSWSFPPRYPDAPQYPISIEFISESVLRVKTTLSSLHGILDQDKTSLILDQIPEKKDIAPHTSDENSVVYKTPKMSVRIQNNPFHIFVYDANGKELTRTLNIDDSKALSIFSPMPFSYVRSASDLHKYAAISLALHPNEHFFGCGESFTQFDKLGQKVVLYTKDANGVESESMYKPVPFYISSRGYGILYNTTYPVSFDFGKDYAEAQTAFLGDENIDFFIFTGTPKEVLASYTDLTGKSPVPPLWSFGLWMSRITYKSETEVREVSTNLKKHRIPCDVIHLDTGWFQENWLCDYKFSDQFQDPEKMIADLKQEGHRICLWQIPYFAPGNPLFDELKEQNLAIADNDGVFPTDDAILDLSNPKTVGWYQKQIKALLDMGVSTIKGDFGEAAPITGRYSSDQSGMAEHNLYPLRYNKALFEIIQQTHGEGIIWGRSAWAGSQRYPVHWGGDCENTDMGMLSSLRGGLSLGACGFSYWSHDVGGFVRPSPEALYLRWTFFGIFTSHMRCHGAPPKEPWAFSENFLNEFRRLLELRYKLIPYIYAQSIHSSANGLPLLRAMVLENPDDPTCFEIDDQYYFGNDMIVAPLFEESTQRKVYLPKGTWVELGTNRLYDGEKWHNLTASVYPGLAFIKGNAILPVVEPALTTDEIDWDTLQYIKFIGGNQPISGLALDIQNKTISPVDDSTHWVSSSHYHI